MTVGEFHDAARRALRAVDLTGDYPIEDFRETGDSLAAASLLFTTLAKHLREAAAGEKWDANVKDVADQLPSLPQLSGIADATRARHAIARLFLAATAAIGLERDVLAGNGGNVATDGRLWLTHEALGQTVPAAHGLEVLAERLRAMHQPTAQSVSGFAAEVGALAQRARVRLPPPAVQAGRELLALRVGPEPYTELLRDLPQSIRPPIGRLLLTARRFDPAVPPDRATLRAYAHVVAAGATTLQAIHRQLGAGETTESWRTAAETWDRLRQDVADVATLGRRDAVAQLAARDVVDQLG